MPSKPNYNFQRAERDRAKKAKKEEKLQEKKQAALRAETPETEAPDAENDTQPGPLPGSGTAE